MGWVMRMIGRTAHQRHLLMAGSRYNYFFFLAYPALSQNKLACPLGQRRYLNSLSLLVTRMLLELQRLYYLQSWVRDNDFNWARSLRVCTANLPKRMSSIEDLNSVKIHCMSHLEASFMSCKSGTVIWAFQSSLVVNGNVTTTTYTFLPLRQSCGGGSFRASTSLTIFVPN